MNLSPGSYIFSHVDSVLDASSSTLDISREKLLFHPDFRFVSGTEGLSIGIEIIREVSYFLRITPAASLYKILVIDNFHFATIEAQNAFLKIFEEPPEYAYIFLVTPYADRLLKTIISRAQVIREITSYQLPVTKQIINHKFQISNLIEMSIGERFLWLENEIKELKDKTQIKMKLLEIVDAFLKNGVELAIKKKINLDAVDYLKEAKWKIEQGFPNPKLLVEGFFVKLE